MNSVLADNMKVLFDGMVFTWVFCNILATILFTPKQMKHMYIDRQCFIGKVFANAFYSLAWGAKLFKFVVTEIVR